MVSAFNVRSGGRWLEPGARFSKNFRARTESHNKNLKPYVYRAVLFTQFSIRTGLTSMQSLMPIHCFLSEIQIIKDRFTDWISYRVFREMGPWSLTSRCFLREELPSLHIVSLHPGVWMGTSDHKTGE